MKKIAVLGLVLAASLVLLALVALKHRPRQAPNDVDPVGTGDESSSLVPAKRRIPPILRPSTPSGEQERPLPQTEVKTTGAPQPKSQEQVVQALNDAYYSDRPADANSTKMSSAIVSAFSDGQAQGARLTGVECRATRCRLGIDFDDLDANRRVMSNIPELLAPAGVDVSDLGFAMPTRVTHPDGTISATVYLFHGPGIP